jgi:hypothetical protein
MYKKESYTRFAELGSLINPGLRTWFPAIFGISG